MRVIICCLLRCAVTGDVYWAGFDERAKF